MTRRSPSSHETDLIVQGLFRLTAGKVRSRHQIPVIHRATPDRMPAGDGAMTGMPTAGSCVGPPGKPVARGIDIVTIRNGRLSVVRTLIAAETDA
jgi:hypothetical protein